MTDARPPMPPPTAPEWLRRAWVGLDDREQMVLADRFASPIDTSRRRIAQRLGRTEERIRQIENAALHRLLAHDPAGRPATAEAMRDRLAQLLGHGNPPEAA